MSKRASASGASAPVSKRTWAAASVACPHRSTSTVGVNQRSPKRARPARPGTTKAVSERFISAASACIQASSAGASSRQTAAGLPENGAVREGVDDGERHREGEGR